MKFFKKSDVIIILVIIVVSIIAWAGYRAAFSDQPARAEIYYYRELVQVIDLDSGKDERFSIPQNENVVFHLYKDGNIRFEESDCPDKVCIHAGKLNMVGENAACLPNSIVLKIVPKESHGADDFDVIIGK